MHPQPHYINSENERKRIFHSIGSDIIKAFSSPSIPMSLAVSDIKQRYNRSVIGPFWIAISQAFFVVGIGLVYSKIFGQPIDKYLPYLATGVAIWGYLTAFIIEGSMAFIASEGIIKQVSAPLTVHIIRLVVRNIIVFLHNFVVIFAINIYFAVPMDALNGLIALFGFFVVTLNGFFLSLIFSSLSVRFRDIPPLVNNIVLFFFFLTPIMWQADKILIALPYVEFNPLFHLIEIVRAPLLGIPFIAESWIHVVFFTVFNAIVAALVYAFSYRKISYWL